MMTTANGMARPREEDLTIDNNSEEKDGHLYKQRKCDFGMSLFIIHIFLCNYLMMLLIIIQVTSKLTSILCMSCAVNFMYVL